MGLLARLSQGMDFGMGAAGAPVPAVANALPVLYQNHTDWRVQRTK